MAGIRNNPLSFGKVPPARSNGVIASAMYDPAVMDAERRAAEAYNNVMEAMRSGNAGKARRAYDDRLVGRYDPVAEAAAQDKAIERSRNDAAYNIAVEAARQGNVSASNSATLKELDERYNVLVSKLPFIDGLTHWNQAWLNVKATSYLKNLAVSKPAEYENIRSESAALAKQYHDIYKHEVSGGGRIGAYHTAGDVLNKYMMCDKIHRLTGTLTGKDRIVKASDKAYSDYENQLLKDMKQAAKTGVADNNSPDNVLESMKKLYAAYVNQQAYAKTLSQDAKGYAGIESKLSQYEARWNELWAYVKDWEKNDGAKQYRFYVGYANNDTLPISAERKAKLQAKIKRLAKTYGNAQQASQSVQSLGNEVSGNNKMLRDGGK